MQQYYSYTIIQSECTLQKSRRRLAWLISISKCESLTNNTHLHHVVIPPQSASRPWLQSQHQPQSREERNHSLGAGQKKRYHCTGIWNTPFHVLNLRKKLTTYRSRGEGGFQRWVVVLLHALWMVHLFTSEDGQRLKDAWVNFMFQNHNRIPFIQTTRAYMHLWRQAHYLEVLCDCYIFFNIIT